MSVALDVAAMTTIAWLGTGLLGAGFVRAALARGEQVRVWNRSAAKAEALRADGAFVAATPLEAAQGAERVHLCLSDDQAVNSVLDVLLSDPSFALPVIDHTTVSPQGAVERSKRLAARGVGMLACPVFMGPVNARQSTGRMLCAGPTALVEQLTPALRAMTGELVPYGEDVSRPCAAKLVGNAMIIGMIGTLADSFALAKSAGLEPKDVLNFASSFPLAGLLASRGAKMVAGDYEASFELSMARKDVRLMIEATGDRPLATLPSIAARMDALIAEGHGSKDLGALSIATLPEAPKKS